MTPSRLVAAKARESPLFGAEELSRVPQEFYHKTGKADAAIQDLGTLPALHAEPFERRVPLPLLLLV